MNCISVLMTVGDCGNLTNPTNGQVSTSTGRTTFGQTATYSCDLGYNLVGGTQRTCQVTGVWSGSVPTCQGMLLLDPEYHVHVSQTMPCSRTYVSCNLITSHSVHCVSNMHVYHRIFFFDSCGLWDSECSSQWPS